MRFESGIHSPQAPIACDVGCDISYGKIQMRCEHKFKLGVALLPAGLKPHKRGRSSVVTVNYTDLIYTLRPCMKCMFCGYSITT